MDRYFLLSEEDVAEIGRLSPRLAKKLSDWLVEQTSPKALAYAEKAREKHRLDEGDVEVDDPTVISPGSDPGAYVMAWTWVYGDDKDADDEDEAVSASDPIPQRVWPAPVEQVYLAGVKVLQRCNLSANHLHCSDHLRPWLGMVDEWTIGPNFENGLFSLVYKVPAGTWFYRKPSDGTDTPCADPLTAIEEMFPIKES